MTRRTAGRRTEEVEKKEVPPSSTAAPSEEGSETAEAEEKPVSDEDIAPAEEEGNAGEPSNGVAGSRTPEETTTTEDEPPENDWGGDEGDGSPVDNGRSASTDGE